MRSLKIFTQFAWYDSSSFCVRSSNILDLSPIFLIFTRTNLKLALPIISFGTIYNCTEFQKNVSVVSKLVTDCHIISRVPKLYGSFYTNTRTGVTLFKLHGTHTSYHSNAAIHHLSPIINIFTN